MSEPVKRVLELQCTDLEHHRDVVEWNGPDITTQSDSSH
jgi:hypothetical protein